MIRLGIRVLGVQSFRFSVRGSDFRAKRFWFAVESFG